MKAAKTASRKIFAAAPGNLVMQISDVRIPSVAIVKFSPPATFV